MFLGLILLRKPNVDIGLKAKEHLIPVYINSVYIIPVCISPLYNCIYQAQCTYICISPKTKERLIPGLA